MADYTHPWQEQYYHALREFDQEILEQKIRMAESLIEACLQELASGHDSSEERVALEDAKVTLRMLQEP